MFMTGVLCTVCDAQVYLVQLVIIAYKLVMCNKDISNMKFTKLEIGIKAWIRKPWIYNSGTQGTVTLRTQIP